MIGQANKTSRFLDDPLTEDCMLKKLKVMKRVQIKPEVVILQEDERKMIFPVINDNDIKMPKKIQKMLRIWIFNHEARAWAIGQHSWFALPTWQRNQSGTITQWQRPKEKK